MLLLLSRTGDDRWSVTELVLGKFTFRNEGTEPLRLRDATEIAGWDPDGNTHREKRRSAAKFIQFIRDEVHGGFAPAVYFVGDATGWMATTEALKQYAEPAFVPRFPSAIPGRRLRAAHDIEALAAGITTAAPLRRIRTAVRTSR